MIRRVSPYFQQTGSVMSKNKKSPVKTESPDPIKTESPTSVKIETPDSSVGPKHWEEVYDNILTMRADRTAAVDTMGCERSFDEAAAPPVQRFQCLVALMLSSQTRDEVNYAAMMRLREHGLTVENIINTDLGELEQLIRPVGFWRHKSKYIKKTCEILKEKYNNDIPDNVEELIQLPGVGPKMAYLVMNIAWKKQTGIGVDTHVHRISARLGWTDPKLCKTPEQTRRSLEDWLPRDRWTEINWLLVGFGQQVCLPLHPRCGECLNRQLCPTGQNWAPSPKKKPSPHKRVKSE